MLTYADVWWQIESVLLLSGQQSGTLAALGTVTAALLQEMHQRERVSLYIYVHTYSLSLTHTHTH